MDSNTQPSAFKANALTDYTIVEAWSYCNAFMYYDRYLKYQFLHLYVRILQKKIKYENIINYDWYIFRCFTPYRYNGSAYWWTFICFEILTFWRPSRARNCEFQKPLWCLLKNKMTLFSRTQKLRNIHSSFWNPIIHHMTFPRS